MKKPDNLILVIFGASGDLNKKKLLPALYNLFQSGRLPNNFAILGIGRKNLNDDSFRDMAASLNEIMGEKKEAFLKILYYLSIDTSLLEDYAKIAGRLVDLDARHHTNGNYIFYMSTPPSMFSTIAENLGFYGLNRQKNNHSQWRRLIIEKPFGYNLDTALSLNQELLKYFSEKQLYRIDHYLGKETVQNIMVTRFSNSIFEPIWNRNYIDHIQITASEDIGIDDRSGYYDHSGALRDMIQNHLMQLTGMITMEPASLSDSTSIRNEMVKVFQSLRPMSSTDIKENVIRGQYAPATIDDKKYIGYKEELGIAATSKTETYIALKIFIDNWRWKDVPIYLRSGKRLKNRVSEAVIQFKETPHSIFGNNSGNRNNRLVIRIQPNESMLLTFGMKVPGTGFEVKEVGMDFHYTDLSSEALPTAYERLLLDCMNGDSTLYSRADAVEATWRFISPILDAWNTQKDIPLYQYESLSWGPSEANRLFGNTGYGWRNPCPEVKTTC